MYVYCKVNIPKLKPHILMTATTQRAACLPNIAGCFMFRDIAQDDFTVSIIPVSANVSVIRLPSPVIKPVTIGKYFMDVFHSGLSYYINGFNLSRTSLTSQITAI